MRIIRNIKIILFSKWKFFPPRNKKILVYDAVYISKYGYNLFYKRPVYFLMFHILITLKII